MKLKSKLLAGASTLVVAGSMMAAVAPEAHGAVTVVGSCTGAVNLVKLTSTIKGQGLTDRTQDGIKAAGALAKDQTTKALVNGGGNCSGHWRPGDPHNPGHVNTEAALSLTSKAQATALLGNATCASGASEQAADTNATDHTWPLTGKITWTFNETYFDPLAAATKPYKMQAQVSLLGIGANGDGADVVSLGGVVLVGVNSGDTLATNAEVGAFHSSVWEDPVAKTGGPAGFNTGYELDLGQAVGCADGLAAGETSGGTIGNANILQVLTGGGGASGTSLLGSSANGIIFIAGQS